MPKSDKILGVLSALWGFAAVALGAYIHHGTNLTDKAMTSLETALLYNLVFAVLSFVMATKHVIQSRWMKLSAWLFLVGSFIFSASLYTRYLFNLDTFASLAPWGGVMIMLGWLAAAAASLTAQNKKAD